MAAQCIRHRSARIAMHQSVSLARSVCVSVGSHLLRARCTLAMMRTRLCSVPAASGRVMQLQ